MTSVDRPRTAVAAGDRNGLHARIREAVAAARRLRDDAAQVQFDAWRLHIQAEQQHGIVSPTNRLTASAAPAGLALRVPAQADSVGDLRAALRRFLRHHPLDQTRTQDAELALTEAAENVVLHAYPVGVTGWIEVHADIEHGSLEIVVLDIGDGLARPSDGLGLGLALIAHLSDDFELRAGEPYGLEVWMRFAFNAV